MPYDKKLDVLTVLLGLAVSVMLAAIPWAYNVHGRLTSIEAAVGKFEIVERHDAELRLLENRLTRVEMRRPDPIR